jgi:hypothetical protein
MFLKETLLFKNKKNIHIINEFFNINSLKLYSLSVLDYLPTKFKVYHDPFNPHSNDFSFGLARHHFWPNDSNPI